MLDAAACGIPIIVNDTLRATERIDGNGITYRLNDVEDLAEKIRSLLDSTYRQQLGTTGAPTSPSCLVGRALPSAVLPTTKQCSRRLA